MLSKGPWVLDKVVGSIINVEKKVKITNGMTLGGGKKTTMLIKGPWVLGLL
jgi:serine acetyltransferase